MKGHFVLSSGRHSDVYFEKFRILEKPDVLSTICASICERFRESGAQIVAGPTTGGVIVAFEVARQLELPAIYVERSEGKRVLRRGAGVAPGCKVLVVDDVLTTGQSVQEVCELFAPLSAEVVGIGVLVDRSDPPAEFDAPLFAAITMPAKSYAPDAVPEWLASQPVQDPGSRRLI